VPEQAFGDVTKRAPVPDGGETERSGPFAEGFVQRQYAKKGSADKQALARTLLNQAISRKMIRFRLGYLPRGAGHGGAGVDVKR